MRRTAFLFTLIFGLAFGLEVHVPQDFSRIDLNFGLSEAEARPRSGGGFRSSPRRSTSPSRTPRPSKPKATRPSTPRAGTATAPKTTPRAGTAAAAGAGAVAAGTVSSDSQAKTSGTTAQRRATSANKFRAGTAPRSVVTSRAGKQIKVAGTPAASNVRRNLTPQSYATRSARQDRYYSSIPPAQRTVVVERYGGSTFGDPFNGLFMYLLLSQSLNSQARFHHNHWDSYSAERQQQLLSENAALKGELAKMQGQPRDPNFVPAGTDPDLIYDDNFVNAAYNPAPVKEKSNFGRNLLILIFGTSLLVGVYLVFFRRTAPNF